jgi:hypothetical protein
MRQTAFKQTATRLTPVRRCAILLRIIAASLPLPLVKPESAASWSNSSQAFQIKFENRCLVIIRLPLGVCGVTPVDSSGMHNLRCWRFVLRLKWPLVTRLLGLPHHYCAHADNYRRARATISLTICRASSSE